MLCESAVAQQLESRREFDCSQRARLITPAGAHSLPFPPVPRVVVDQEPDPQLRDCGRWRFDSVCRDRESAKPRARRQATRPKFPGKGRRVSAHRSEKGDADCSWRDRCRRGEIQCAVWGNHLDGDEIRNARRGDGCARQHRQRVDQGWRQGLDWHQQCGRESPLRDARDEAGTGLLLGEQKEKTIMYMVTGKAPDLSAFIEVQTTW